MTSHSNLSIIGNSSENARFNIFKILTEQLSLHLKDRYNISIYGYRKEGINADSQSVIQRFYLPVNSNPIHQLSYRLSTLRRLLAQSDISLFLGAHRSLLFPLFRLFPKKEVIVFLDKSHWQKKTKGKLARLKAQWDERLAVKYADRIIVEHSYLGFYIQKTYQKESIIIPFGGDHIQPDPVNDGRFSFADKPYVLGIITRDSSQEAEKILKGFSQSKEFHLALLGNWKEDAEMEKIHSRYEMVENIHLLDIEKVKTSFDAVKRGARFYLHHHSDDTTHQLLLESMSLGIPVVALDTAMNREVTRNEAIYYRTEQNPAKVVENITYGQHEFIGKTLQGIIKENHSWADISMKYHQVFTGKLLPQEALPEPESEAPLLPEKRKIKNENS